MKRGGPTGELKKEYDDWVQKFGPLIKHYRLQGNFLEVSPFLHSVPLYLLMMGVVDYGTVAGGRAVGAGLRQVGECV
jgi:hypothetical protein